MGFVLNPFCALKIVIDANNSSFFSLKEVLQHRSLLKNLAKRDFLVRYKQAVAGIGWALVKPLINIVVFGYLSTKIMSGEAGTDNFLTVTIAVLIWQLFANLYTEVSNSILSNSNLFSKVFFPKIIIPLSSILVCLVDFMISLVILVIMFIVAGKPIHWQIIYAPLFILFVVLNGFAIGLFFATINVRFRDVKFIVPLILQLGMFISPVIFPTHYYTDRLPASLDIVYILNPMVVAIDGFKYSLLGEPFTYEWYYLPISCLITFSIMIFSLKYFYRFEKNFVDYI